MTSHHEEIRLLAKEFESCRKIMLALGDEQANPYVKSCKRNYGTTAG